MSKYNVSVNNVELAWLALVILIALFWGEPDLHDALIHFLMR